ncbi:hormogonium polysaccharide secretion pseudopilin HpsC [Fischerella sp. JS2]|uniref:hormogonium polysaccharide secretion pseudopilin HpsC n=1 Tax=Fischerella sp. JS2 TaxID=2597771 RepID=UPI0028EBB929|nr:hormogonium polysaccharide secretion pseudopilin HpsC [Fischerella sp. JS2]
MKHLLIFILSRLLKSSAINKKIGGFTLIELLVAMVLAVLVITPLMAFMINTLDSDRKEQAKATTEQEIQAALDYISRDMQQAIYIYDADGVTRNNSTTISSSGIKDQIPPTKNAPNCTSTTTCTPVLVFWKREFLADSVGVTSTTDTNRDDGFAYSLVAYYLITNPSSTSPWSPSARIARFQIRGKVGAENANSTGTASDTGYNAPPLGANGATLKEKMNQWKTSLVASNASPPGATSYTQRVETLVDYISTTGPTPTCSSGQGIGTSGFYACVDANEVLAQVYVRGNAYVRLKNNNNTSYNDAASAYFPSINKRLEGRGYIYTK